MTTSRQRDREQRSRAQHYRVLDSALGPIGIAWTEAGLTRLQLPDRDAARTERRLAERLGAARWDGPWPDAITATVKALQAYAAGEAITFEETRLSFEGVPDFNARIYRALRQVAWGKTTTYGALANAVGEPGAARAVGVAMGRNPWPIIVPCHRVLAAQGKIGGFSAPGGAATKQVLLRLEGASWSGDDRDAPLLPGLV